MCGINGCIGTQSALDMVLEGGYYIQYRGDDGAGAAVFDPEKKKGSRLISEGLKIHGTVEQLRKKLNAPGFSIPTGTSAIAHNRYATIGGICDGNIQPLVWDGIAVAHNGDLEEVYLDGHWQGIEECRKELGKTASLIGTTDTEVIPHLLARQNGSITERIVKVLNFIRGAFSLVFLTEDGHLIAARDPRGIRPLSWGKNPSGAYFFSSEDYFFPKLGIASLGEVHPGEVIVISPELEVSHHKLEPQPLSTCAFEYNYFAFPGSIIAGKSVSDMRMRFGKELASELLAKNSMPKVDMLAPVLDSSLLCTSGFHEYLWENGLRIPLRFAILRSHYVGRSFTTPGKDNRARKVGLKHIIDANAVRGKKVGVVDDSIVRSTTIRQLIEMLLFQAGAKEVHVFIPCPRIIRTCPYGMDMKTLEELEAAHHSLEETTKRIGATSLHHLSLEGFRKCFENHKDFCMGCFTGQYPTK